MSGQKKRETFKTSDENIHSYNCSVDSLQNTYKSLKNVHIFDSLIAYDL